MTSVMIRTVMLSLMHEAGAAHIKRYRSQYHHRHRRQAQQIDKQKQMQMRLEADSGEKKNSQTWTSNRDGEEETGTGLEQEGARGSSSNPPPPQSHDIAGDDKYTVQQSQSLSAATSLCEAARAGRHRLLGPQHHDTLCSALRCAELHLLQLQQLGGGGGGGNDQTSVRTTASVLVELAEVRKGLLAVFHASLAAGGGG